MTLSEIKSMSNEPTVEALQVTMEWTCIKPHIVFGGHTQKVVEVNEESVQLEDESIDIIKLHKNKHFENHPIQLLNEAKRVLKKNGRIMLYFYNREDNGIMTKLINKFFQGKKNGLDVEEHIVLSMEKLMHTIEDVELLIDRNSIGDNGLIVFELIKRENEKIVQIVNKA